MAYEFIDEVPQGGYRFIEEAKPNPKKPLMGPKASMAAQGLLGGFGDEGAALAGALYDKLTKGEQLPESYAQRLAAERTQLARQHQESPVSSMALEFAGAAPTMLGGAKLLQKPLRSVPNWLKNVGGASAMGGVYGAGTGNTPGERTEGAITGAALAPVAAGGLSLATNVGGHALSALINAAGWANADRLTQHKLVQALQRDAKAAGMEPAAYAEQLVSRISGSTKPLTVTDVGGENLRSLAKASAALPGVAREKIATALKLRSAEEPVRLSQDIKDLVHTSDDYYGDLNKLLKERQEKAKPLYKEAEDFGPIESHKLAKMMFRPDIRDAFAGAKRSAANQDITLPELYPFVDNGGYNVLPRSFPDVRTIQHIKMELDKAIEKNTNDFGKLNPTGRELVGLKNEMLAEVDKHVPAYAKAREQFAGDTAILQAMTRGERLMHTDPNKLKFELGELPPEEREAFKAGAAKAIHDIVLRTNDGSDAATRIAGNQWKRDLLKQVFEKPEDYAEFQRRLDDEILMQRTKNQFGGSRTAVLGNDMEDLQSVATVPRLLANMANSSWGSALGNVGTIAANRLTGMGPQVAEKLEPVLFGRGRDLPTELPKGVLDRLIPVNLDPAIYGGLGALTGSQFNEP